MNYLRDADYPTARIILTASYMLYFSYEFQNEIRIGVLYEFINGIEPIKSSDIENIGRQTGKLHNLMQQYNGNLCLHGKPFFIDRYINILTEMKYPQVDKFKEYGNLLWERVKGLPNGFCHGDYHTGNMLLNTEGQYVLFDFDAAANAFSVYDVAVICDMTNYFSLSDQEFDETSRMLERFLKGYSEYNSISNEVIRSVYDFIAIRHFEVQATIIENLGLSCVDEKFINDQYAWLMHWNRLCETRI
jgi:Ser/Thr protein kinase RdoA (MazF antagonist)